MSEFNDDFFFRNRAEQKIGAYNEGRVAYLTSRARRDDNPYNNNDEWDLFEAWLDGFTDAGWDE